MTEEFTSSTHPPLPPTTEDTRFSWLRLLRSRRVGAVTFHRLLAEFGSAQNALDALPEVARAAGDKEYEICSTAAIDAEIKAARAAKARLLRLGEPNYPTFLADLKDAPPILWTIGEQNVLTRPMIAIVGARNASSLGIRMARSLARDLSERGYVVVSGLARGIDTAAHQASTNDGTVAVLAGGVDVTYPAENAALAQEITRTGVLLSEQPMGLQPQARHFPARNRLISGMAQAVVVVEAAAKSGSLITARDALDQGREVLAVPGHPFDARAAGGNRLIRDGATLVRNADDVVAALPRLEPLPRPRLGKTAEPASPPAPAPPRDRRSLQQTAALHQQILSKLGPTPVSEDQLCRDLAAPARDLAPALTELELDGSVVRHAGGGLSLGHRD